MGGAKRRTPCRTSIRSARRRRCRRSDRPRAGSAQSAPTARKARRPFAAPRTGGDAVVRGLAHEGWCRGATPERRPAHRRHRSPCTRKPRSHRDAGSPRFGRVRATRTAVRKPRPGLDAGDSRATPANLGTVGRPEPKDSARPLRPGFRHLASCARVTRRSRGPRRPRIPPWFRSPRTRTSRPLPTHPAGRRRTGASCQHRAAPKSHSPTGYSGRHLPTGQRAVRLSLPAGLRSTRRYRLEARAKRC